MAYSPPSWNAVDFHGTGQIVSGPRWDRVNFITPPGHEGCFDLVCRSTLQPNNQVAQIHVVGTPSIAFQANHQVAQVTTVGTCTVAFQGWKTYFAALAATAKPTLAFQSAPVFVGAFAITAKPSATFRSTPIFNSAVAITTKPTINFQEYTPAFRASFALQPHTATYFNAAPSVVATFQLVGAPYFQFTTQRTFKASFVTRFRPVLAFSASTTAPFGSRMRASFQIRLKSVVTFHA